VAGGLTPYIGKFMGALAGGLIDTALDESIETIGDYLAGYDGSIEFRKRGSYACLLSFISHVSGRGNLNQVQQLTDAFCLEANFR
jgi:hypothetical protein